MSFRPHKVPQKPLMSTASHAPSANGSEPEVHHAIDRSRRARQIAGRPRRRAAVCVPPAVARCRCTKPSRGTATALRTILPRHEQGGAFAAQGYARSTGKLGVVMATSGPGATNLVTAIADAKLDSIPMLCITGQVPTGVIGTDAFQETPMVEICRGITKHHYLVSDVADLPRIMKEAIHVATSGRPGPVLIDMPKDVQMADVHRGGSGRPNEPGPVTTRIAPIGPRRLDQANRRGGQIGSPPGDLRRRRGRLGAKRPRSCANSFPKPASRSSPPVMGLGIVDPDSPESLDWPRHARGRVRKLRRPRLRLC